LGVGILEKVIGNGKNYDPSLPSDVNTLTTLTVGAGYWVRVSNGATMNVTGQIVYPATTSIALKAGWNHAAYLLQSSVAVKTALAQLLSEPVKLVKVIGEGKNFDPFLPDSANTLTDLKPGYSYWIYINTDQDFKYTSP